MCASNRRGERRAKAGWVTSPSAWPPGACDLTLFGDTVSAGEVVLEEGDLRPVTGVLITRRSLGYRTPCEDRSRDGRDEATSQGT